MGIKERVFSNDWSSLTEEQFKENIKYLLEHYKDCEIHRFGENNFSINNFNFYKNVNENFYFANNQWFFMNRDKMIYNLLEDLMCKCKQEFEIRKEKEYEQTKSLLQNHRDSLRQVIKN